MKIPGLDAWLRFDPPGDMGFVFIVLALAVAAYGVWLYKRTPAPLSSGMRGILTALRVGLMLLVLAVLARPMLSFPLPQGAEKGVLVLYDRSASLNLPSGYGEGSREDVLQAVRLAVGSQLDPVYPVVEIPFDATIGSPVARDESLPLARGLATNLGEALEKCLSGLGDTEAGALLLVSDGAQTQGPDPLSLARRLGLPINVIPLGTSNPVRDLSLARVRANPDAFVGEPTPVETVLQLHGLPDQSVKVSLWDITGEPVLVDSATAEIQGSGADHRLRLHMKPTEGGLRYYEVRVGEISGEQSLGNNRRMFSMDVRESKTDVALFSGKLTWDHTFFKRALEADSTLSVSAGYLHAGKWKQLGSNALPDLAQGQFGNTRVMILDHVSPADLSSQTLSAITRWVDNGGGLIVVSGGDMNLSEWHATELSAVLPLAPGASSRQRDVTLEVAPRAARHPLMDPQVPSAQALSAWGNLPPVQVSAGLGNLKAQSEALLVTSGQGPVLSWGSTGRGGTLLMAGGGFWRWEFMSTTRRDLHWPLWWRQAVKWMAQPEVEAHISVQPTEYVVGQDTPVRFSGRALDTSFQPLEDVKIQVLIIPQGEQDPVRVAGLRGRDLLTGEVSGLAPGRYRYQAMVEAQGKEYPPVTGTFAVDSLTAEDRRLEADPEFLRELAKATGGTVFDPMALKNLPDSLRASTVLEVERAVIDLWAHPAVFGLFVVLASGEWFLRRRRGLV